MKDKITVRQIYHEVAQSGLSPHATNSEFVLALQKLCAELGRRLESLSQEEFAKAWILHSISQEFLKYSIEDDLVDVGRIKESATAALSELIASKNGFSEPLIKSLGVCRRLVQETPLKTKSVLVETIDSGLTYQVKGRIPLKGQPNIQVSSQDFDFVALLEDSVADPRFVKGVLKAFSRAINELRSQEQATSLCFIEKDVGPIGAISMLSSLVADSGLPASIYRSSHWASRSQVAAYQPNSSDRVILVYDLLVTGDGIVQAAKDLRDRYNVHICAAVVLFGFGPRRSEIGVNGSRLKVKALGWYEKLQEEFESLRNENVLQTQHLKLISNAWSHDAPALDRRTALAQLEPTEGGNSMSRTWKADLNAYRYPELRAITFATDDDLKRAVKMIWAREELYGLPREPAGVRTMVVPADAVCFFEGLDFSVHSVVSAAELSTETKRWLRKEQGHH